MEIDTISKQEYNEDLVQTNLREIFEPESYISVKDANPFYSVKTRLQEIIENLISPKEINFEEELNAKFLELDFGSEFDIDATKIGVQDAIFFVNLLNQQNIINYSVDDNGINLTTSQDKKINATKSLINVLQTSLDTNKPIRLDFDRDVTVILKLDKDGKVQAHFIPGTAEVESYLKNNIQCLKQRFDDENINYSSLGYSKYREENQSKRQKRSDK